ncbi:MAG TPA: YifB family Mg chelatase-like AAA ATPase [Mycobacteriales bacterium]|jgi:magnesium chelatase family protein|nr:YifB family Mg chelatase-like AAA ATPase [Mycobacteriales bacterium]
MAFAATRAVALLGLAGHEVIVEGHVATGLPAFLITGLPDAAVAQARDRVRAAVQSSGFAWPPGRITVGLGPAWLPKQGSSYDLSVAIAILAAHGEAPRTELPSWFFLGELGLDGRIRGVRGVLPAVMAARRSGAAAVVVPAENLGEAQLVPGITVHAARDLRLLVTALRGRFDPDRPEPFDELALGDASDEPADKDKASTADAAVPPIQPDLADVAGQELGRFGVEVAAAGGHHVAFFGPPGAGKTMLAERLPGLLPPLSQEAALEVAAVASVVGHVKEVTACNTRPPYQAPHHTSSVAAVVGGGSSIARPGAVSLAHCGVLFLDEAGEFRRGVLDALRQPLERGEVTLARSGGIVSYPARIQLVLASNPCGCGAKRQVGCECGPAAIRRFRSRLSGPLLDRIDIQLELSPVTPSSLLADREWVETSEVVANRVAVARTAAKERWKSFSWDTNSAVPGSALRGKWRLPRAATVAADHALDMGELSARGYDRVLRLSWTLADLRGTGSPCMGDVNEAMALRLRSAV